MIKKLNILLLAAFAVLIGMKALKNLGSGNGGEERTMAAAKPATDRVSELRPTICYAPRKFLSNENRLTNRNGLLLDIVRAIFPKAKFERMIDADMDSVAARLRSDPSAAFVNYGEHPKIDEFPHAETPLGETGYCVMTLRSNPWKYEGPASLEKLRLGVSVGFIDYETIETLIDRQGTNGMVTLVSEGRQEGLYNRILSGEIDAVAETAGLPNEVLQSAISIGAVERMKMSPCIERTEMFFRMSGRDPEFTERLRRDYEAGWKRIRASGEFRRICEYYGVKEW